MQPQDTEELRLPLKKQWVDALITGDGFSLMKYLVEEPRLVSIRCGRSSSRNVLHLAVRKDWYGLVLQITEIFSPSDPTRCHGLQPEILRDLLIEKEMEDASDVIRSHIYGCSSRLDVFGMVIINRHKAINTLLARTIWSCRLFDEGHPYAHVMKASKSEFQSAGPAHLDGGNRAQQRKVLNTILEKRFPDLDLTTWLELKQAPNMVGGLSSVGDLGRLGPVVESWMLARPFLPLSEHLVLESCTKDFLRFEMNDLVQAVEETAFIRYLLTIDDTRRTFVHLAFLQFSCNWSFLRNWLLDILRQTGPINRPAASLPVDSTSLSPEPDFIETLQSCFSLQDSSGRIPLEVYLASATPHYRDRRHRHRDHNLDVETLELFRWIHLSDSVITKHNPSGDWEYDGWRCSIDTKAVHEVNGYYYSYVPDSARYTVADFLVACSQRGHGISRRELMDYFLDIPDFLPQGHFPLLVLSAPDYDSANLVEVTPLQHAVLVGDTAMVKRLAKENRAWDAARFKNQSNTAVITHLQHEEEEIQESLINTSALQLAAAQGSPEILRILLDSGTFDPCYRNGQGDTALHIATRSSGPFLFPVMLGDFVEIPGYTFYCTQKDWVGNFRGPEGSLQTKDLELPLVHEGAKEQEATYQGCLIMLLQAGIDIWQRNNANEVPSLHKMASAEYRLWWFERLDKETQEQTAKLTTAANALSVTAALVATASYIGPLQPPLGYGSAGNDPVDTVQADFLSVRVFIVCNTLSFYIALVAIMLSLTPSLPMPQESMLDEMKRIRRSVTLGLVSLIMAIVTLLMAFAAASIAVFPESWNRKGLSTGTLVVGSFMCSIVLALCWIRAVRLMFHKSHRVRNFYRRWVYI